MTTATSRAEIDELVRQGVIEFEMKMGRPATRMEIEVIRMGLAEHAVHRIDVPKGKAN